MHGQFLCPILFCVIHYFYSQHKPLSLQWFLVFSHLVYCRLNDRQCPVTDPSAPCIFTRLPGEGGREGGREWEKKENGGEKENERGERKIKC